MAGVAQDAVSFETQTRERHLSHPVLVELAGLDRLKTWSLIVTLFGDLEGISLTGKQIGHFLADVGIKPEAARVALHRLKKDGWIETRKDGREVRYRMSDHGLRETASVSTDVYRQDVKYPEGFRLFLVDEDDGAGPMPKSAIHLFRNILLVPARSPDIPENAVPLVSENPLPQWVLSRLVSPALCRLATRVSACCQAFRESRETFSQDEGNAVRLLVLHHWRKMALRPATWAHIALQPGGALAVCHLEATALLAQLRRPEG